MRIPGVSSLVFLLYLLVCLPWLALRSARHVRHAGTERPLPPRETILLGTLLMLCLLLALSFVTGRAFGFRIFAVPSLGISDALAAVGAFGVACTLRVISRVTRSEAERRTLFVYRLVPRSPREWALWTCVVLVASVAEEAAYRGVGMAILTWSFGNPWPAAAVSAIAFSLAHWTQGAKSMGIIFAMALLMHALVAITGTLVLAMGVHAAYDFVAGYLISREAAAWAAPEAPRDAPG